MSANQVPASNGQAQDAQGQHLQVAQAANIDALPPTIESMWFVFSTQLTIKNTLSVIYIAADVCSTLTESDVSFILAAYQRHVGLEGLFVKDGAVAGRILLGPLSYFLDLGLLHDVQFPLLPDSPRVAAMHYFLDGVHKITEVKGPKVKIPRPANAFILYRKDLHAETVAMNPNVHNNIISVIIGEMWQNESCDVRKIYLDKAEQAKADHALKYPGYTYQPRKPSEKKRRMTQKKIRDAQLAIERSASITGYQSGLVFASRSNS